MRGGHGTRGLTIALLPAIALAGAVASPGTTRAADQTGTQVLDGEAQAATVADLDGDGANELVRIVDEDGTGRVVEAWGAGEEGWTRLGSAVLRRVDASGVDQGPVRGEDASAVIVWHLDRRPRVLVLARWGSPAADCCQSVFELVPRAASIELQPRAAEGEAALLVQAVDVDGDGTDELIQSQPFFGDGLGEIEVLRWDGDAFRSVLFQDDPEGLGQFYAAETDGVAGVDLILGPTAAGDVRRISWVDGQPIAEVANLELPQRGYISGIADGALVVTLPDELRIVRWPRGRQPFMTARRDGLDFPYAGVAGSGKGTVLAVQESSDPRNTLAPLAIYDLELRQLGEMTPAPTAVRLAHVFDQQSGSSRALQRRLYPYIGPIPGADPRATEGYAWLGVMVRPDDDGGHVTTPIAPMAGLWPIGRVGPDDGWMALSSGYLSVGGPATLYGGIVSSRFGRTSLVPVDDLLRADEAAATLELRGAAAIGEPVGGVTPILARGDGFGLTVRAEPGSWIATWDRRTVNEVTIEGDSTLLEFPAPRPGQDDENQPVEAWVVVVTPDGRAAVTEWEGSFLRTPPSLSVAGRTDGFSFSATLEGIVGPHTAVIVDGQTVPVDWLGRFRASVGAWPWPRAVEIVARDLVGNEVVDRVEVVGPLDYRGLPWAALLAAATLAAGVTLFVRIPRLRTINASDPGDGRLEELDPIDAADMIGR